MAYGAADAANIDRYIRRVVPNAPLAGRGQAFVASANRYGVSPYLLAAIARKETQFGLTAGRFKNNAFGWGVHLGPDVNTSRTWEEGIDKVARGLSGDLYKGAGLTRADQILPRYAPPSENNTQQYINQVNSWLREMGADPNANVFGPGVGDTDAATRRLGSPATSTAQKNAPQASGLGGSVAQSLLQRRAGESLFKSVLSGVLNQKLTQSLQQNPDGVASAAQRRAQSGEDSALPPPGKVTFTAGGGPEAHGTRALGNWQSDNAYDIMGRTGDPIYIPVSGVVTKISGQPGGDPGFAGYGVTVRTPEGDLFFKHLGTSKVKVGQRLSPGTLVGTLDAKTAGGPHLHLGGTNRGPLDRLNKWYLGNR